MGRLRWLDQFGLPAGIVGWLAAAWLIELALYVAPAFASLRCRLGKLRACRLALVLTLSAVIPYLVYAPATGCFEARAVGVLIALAGALCFWYVILPRSRWTDLGFVALAAAVTLAKVWTSLYCSPAARLPMETLGHLMWIRLGIVCALLLRGIEGVGFGWWPAWREWKVGLRQFLLLLPFGLVLGWLTGLLRWDPKPPADLGEVVLAAATFFGMLWVVALSEEFFFRGLLQQWLTQWLAGPWRGLILASVLFGLAHLPFRGFPNWRFATLAAVAGFFYGRAFQQGGGIRAAMVAHALTNTLWRRLLD